MGSNEQSEGSGELLPCPFCGSVCDLLGTDHFAWRLCKVHCPACATSTACYLTRAEAAAAWNRRASHSSVDTERLEVEAIDLSTPIDARLRA